MICVGLDSGSRALKIVLIEYPSLKVIASSVALQSINQDTFATSELNKLLSNNNINQKDIAFVVATGYARNSLSIADITITEITCHARGIFHNNNNAEMIIEIGGQDSKVIFLEKNGIVRDFTMNDKCAAGTGRFLELVSNQLNIDLSGDSTLIAKSKAPAIISSMCAVFAESEIIALLAKGTPREDILAGVQSSIASRISTMAGKLNISGDVIFTGGVARIEGMSEAISKKIKKKIKVAKKPQLTGALGAAIIAASRFKKSKKSE